MPEGDGTVKEVKFRGMTVNSGWVYGNLAILREKYGSVTPGHYISNKSGAPFAYQVRPETVGQFTTMLVRSDKELYQGDIIYYTPEENLRNPRDGTGTYVVVWDKTRLAWWLKNALADSHENERWDDFKQLLNNCFENRRIEIIGNVHENPELVKGLVQ